MPLAEIKRAHVIRILDSIMAERKPYRANRALAAIKKLFAWSRDRGYMEHHPTAVTLVVPRKSLLLIETPAAYADAS